MSLSLRGTKMSELKMRTRPSRLRSVQRNWVPETSRVAFLAGQPKAGVPVGMTLGIWGRPIHESRSESGHPELRQQGPALPEQVLCSELHFFFLTEKKKCLFLSDIFHLAYAFQVPPCCYKWHDFFFMDEEYSIVSIIRLFIIFSSINEHLVGCHLLAIMNNASVKMKIFLQNSNFSSSG